MLVKNVNGSSRFTRPNGYNSWLEYWESQIGLKAHECFAKDCYSRNYLVGAHVQKVSSDDKAWYIIPLCSSCNQRIDYFEVPESWLVPVPSNL